jgi:hypothetical protein
MLAPAGPENKRSDVWNLTSAVYSNQSYLPVLPRCRVLHGTRLWRAVSRQGIGLDSVLFDRPPFQHDPAMYQFRNRPFSHICRSISEIRHLRVDQGLIGSFAGGESRNQT